MLQGLGGQVGERQVNIYRIHPAPCEPAICTTMADSPAEALALVRQNDWARQQLTSDACAFKCEDGMEFEEGMEW